MAIEIPEDIGERIKRVRKRKGEKLVPLAKAALTTQPNLSQIENNLNLPSERTLILLATKLKDNFGIPELTKYAENDGAEEIEIVGRVAAGKPIIKFDDSDKERIFIPSRMKARDGATFALVVTGDSMHGIGIRHRDLVIVHKTTGIPADGTVVVVRIGSGEASEFTIKKWFKKGSKVTLRPENPEYDDIEIETDVTKLTVEGKFAGLIRFGE